MNGSFRCLSVRTLVAALALVAAASLRVGAAPPAVEASQTRLAFISSSTWTTDPEMGRVHVLASVTATSHTVDSVGRRYYYDRVQLTLPAFSAGFVATNTGGIRLPVSVVPAAAPNVTLVVGLGKRLYSGQSTSLDLKFDLVDAGGSTDRDFRIGRNLMSFPVLAFGSPNTPGSSVTVVFPHDFTVQEEFGGLTRGSLSSGDIVFSSGVISDSTEVNAWFTAARPVPPTDFATRSLIIGPLKVTIHYWADDPGWADQVERVMESGYMALRGLIGLGDPAGKTLSVEEASTQDLGGYGGAFDPRTGQVLVSYFADPFTILHEMAHMWLNSSLIADRWIQEGFASFYAEQATLRVGFTDHAPLLTDRMRRAAVPLNDWPSTGRLDSLTESYLYGASLEVARQIAAEVGLENLKAVWNAAHSGTAAYQPVHGAQSEVLGQYRIDWRRLLDLLEQRSGQPFAAVWWLWVLDPSQGSLLRQRSDALSDYAYLLDDAGAWNLPAEIRRALDGWQFDQARALIARAGGVLTQRDQITLESAAEQTKPPPTLRTAFEQSGVEAASVEATHELAVLSELAAARQARANSGGEARGLGFLNQDPESDLQAARAAFASGDLTRAQSLAKNARAAWEGSGAAGQMRALGMLLVLAGVLMLIGLLIWRRGSGRLGVLTRVAVSRLAGPAERVGSTAGAARSRLGASKVGVAASAGRARAAPAARTARGAGEALAGAVAARAAAVSRGTRTAWASIAARTSKPVAAAADSPATAMAAPDRGRVSRTRAVVDRALPAAKKHRRASGDSEGPVLAGGSEEGSGESAYDLLVRGQALLRDRHNAQAAVVLERAARLERRKGSILEALGRAYFNSGQHARAAETFEALLEIDPSAHYGHFGLGLSFARLGRAQEARTHLRMAAALDPTSETYRRALEKVESTIA